MEKQREKVQIHRMDVILIAPINPQGAQQLQVTESSSRWDKFLLCTANRAILLMGDWGGVAVILNIFWDFSQFS